VDELVLDDLEAGYRLAECVAVARVVHRVLEDSLRSCDRARGRDHALALKLPHQVLEAFALLADEVGNRDVAVLEKKLGGVGGVHAQLLERPRDLETLGAFLDDEVVEPGMSAIAPAPGDDARPAAA